MIFFSIFLSLFVLGLLYLLMKSSDHRKWMFARYLASGLFGVLFASCFGLFPGFIVTLAFGCVLAILWDVFRMPKTLTIPLLVSAMFVGHWICYWLIVKPEVDDQDAIRKQIVPLAIDERLTRPATPAIDAKLTIEVQQIVDELESLIQERRQRTSRDAAFDRILASRWNRVINNRGFGSFQRTSIPESTNFYLPDRTPIPQRNRLPLTPIEEEIDHPVFVPMAKPSRNHRPLVAEFAFSFGWGWERSPGEYLGFQPHQLGIPDFNESMASQEQSIEFVAGWKIDSVLLIGLLHPPKPTVYLTQNFPRMDEAKRVSTREPDEFEMAGLKSVAEGSELYVGKTRSGKAIRMVGGLRAAKSCTACHGCREGELLGAFSYTLVK